MLLMKKYLTRMLFFFLFWWNYNYGVLPLLERWNINLCIRYLKRYMSLGFDIWHTVLGGQADDLMNFWITFNECWRNYVPFSILTFSIFLTRRLRELGFSILVYIDNIVMPVILMKVRFHCSFKRFS